MKEWKVYERGKWYRVARPSRWFWHWAQDYSWGDSFTFETTNYDEAKCKAAELNAREVEALRYKKGQWHEAT